MKRLISLLLVICLCLAALPCAALAANVNISPNEQVFIVDCSMSVEDALSAAYENLTPEAKDIFNRVIAENAELVEYHRDNIDSNYCTDLDKNTVGTYSAMSSAAAIIQDVSHIRTILHCRKMFQMGMISFQILLKLHYLPI